MQTLAAADMKPSLEFREKARLEFGKAVHNARAGRGSLFGWAGRWATVALAVVILIVGSTSTVAASGGSMPDDTLYTVKLVVEDIREVFTFSEEKKTELHAEFTERRVTEIISMAEKGKPEAAEKATQRLGSHLDAIVMLEVGELPRAETATFDAATPQTADELPRIEEETVPTEEAPKLFQKGPAAEKGKGPPEAGLRAGQEKAARWCSDKDPKLPYELVSLADDVDRRRHADGQDHRQEDQEVRVQKPGRQADVLGERLEL